MANNNVITVDILIEVLKEYKKLFPQGSTSDALLYVQQVLTDPQKLQARENIGATSVRLKVWEEGDQ